MERATVLFDPDCGVCRWTSEKLRVWDGRRGKLRFVSLRSPEADELLGSMDAAAKFASWHLVTEDGHVYSAGAAVAPVMRRLRGGRAIAVTAEAFPIATESAYRSMVRNRPRLSRVLGQKACSVDPSRTNA